MKMQFFSRVCGLFNRKPSVERSKVEMGRQAVSRREAEQIVNAYSRFGPRVGRHVVRSMRNKASVSEDHSSLALA